MVGLLISQKQLVHFKIFKISHVKQMNYYQKNGNWRKAVFVIDEKPVLGDEMHN